MDLQTGWFGIAGQDNPKAKVHIVKKDSTPLCNSRMSENAEFQWCYNGVQLTQIECQHCRRIWMNKEKK